jgi:hypothetical protein
MTLSQLSLLFLAQLGFGSLLTFVVNDRAALGAKYFKVSGWVLVGVYGLALTLGVDALLDPQAAASARVLAWGLVTTTVAVLGFTSVSGWDRPGLEALLLWVSVLAGGAVVASASLSGLAADTPSVTQALVLAGAFGSSLVLGFCTWGMALGHWYLVSQDLDIRHLARLVAPLPGIFLFKTLVSGLALWLMWDQFLGPGHRSLGDIMEREPARVLDVVNVWARIPVGLVAPAVMAFMARVTVRMEKTQPATGILYAMCVLVYLGDLIGKMVEGSTGVPL